MKLSRRIRADLVRRFFYFFEVRNDVFSKGYGPDPIIVKNILF